MSFFDGKTSGRRINLGGASSTVGRDAALARSREERTRRAEDRLCDTSARTLQRVFRGRRCARFSRAAERDAWDATFATKVAVAVGAAGLAERLERSVRALWWFARPGDPADDARLGKVALVAFASAHAPPGEGGAQRSVLERWMTPQTKPTTTTTAMASSSVPSAPRWSLLHRYLVRSLVELGARDPTAAGASPAGLNICLKAAEALTNPDLLARVTGVTSSATASSATSDPTAETAATTESSLSRVLGGDRDRASLIALAARAAMSNVVNRDATAILNRAVSCGPIGSEVATAVAVHVLGALERLGSAEPVVAAARALDLGLWRALARAVREGAVAEVVTSPSVHASVVASLAELVSSGGVDAVLPMVQALHGLASTLPTSLFSSTAAAPSSKKAPSSSAGAAKSGSQSAAAAVDGVDADLGRGDDDSDSDDGDDDGDGDGDGDGDDDDDDDDVDMGASAGSAGATLVPRRLMKPVMAMRLRMERSRTLTPEQQRQRAAAVALGKRWASYRPSASLLRSLAKVSSTSFARRAFDTLFRRGAVHDEDHAAARALCLFYASLVARGEPHARAVLGMIAFEPALVRRIWKQLLNDGRDLVDLATGFRAGRLPRGATDTASLGTLFALCYDYTLLAASDAAFSSTDVADIDGGDLPSGRDGQGQPATAATKNRHGCVPFSASEELPAVIASLKDVCFSIVWHPPSGAAAATLAERPVRAVSRCARDLARLLRSLHDRDARVPCAGGDGAWLEPSLPRIEQLLEEVTIDEGGGDGDGDGDDGDGGGNGGGGGGGGGGLGAGAPGHSAALPDPASTSSSSPTSSSSTSTTSSSMVRALSRRDLPGSAATLLYRLRARRLVNLLREIPFVVPFDDRVTLFRKRVYEVTPDSFGGYYSSAMVEIRRTSVYQDAYDAVMRMSDAEQLRGRWRVSFVNAEGLPEAGVDGGGLFKEFMVLLSSQAFTDFGLFLETESHELYPNPGSALAVDDHLSHFRFLGRIIGKALWEGVLVDAPFAGFFLAKLLGRSATLNDLPSLDVQLARSITSILELPPAEVEDLGLTFALQDDVFGEVRTVRLKSKNTTTTTTSGGGGNADDDDGGDPPVTGDNVREYALLVAHYRLNVAIRAQARAFVQGFSDVVDPDWVKMFPRESELRLLIEGTREFSVADLRAHCSYQGYEEHSPQVAWFWDIVESLSTEDRMNLLKFVTSVDRAPLGGFKHLNPRFTVSRGGEIDRLPSASTCFHLFKLPPYESRETMREKLVMAIRSGAGFEMS